MVLFFARGEADSDKFVKYCYSYYRDIMSGCGNDLPKTVQIIREEGKNRALTQKTRTSICPTRTA